MADGTQPSGLGTVASPYQVSTLDNLYGSVLPQVRGISILNKPPILMLLAHQHGILAPAFHLSVTAEQHSQVHMMEKVSP